MIIRARPDPPCVDFGSRPEWLKRASRWLTTSWSVTFDALLSGYLIHFFAGVVYVVDCIPTRQATPRGKYSNDSGGIWSVLRVGRSSIPVLRSQPRYRFHDYSCNTFRDWP